MRFAILALCACFVFPIHAMAQAPRAGAAELSHCAGFKREYEAGQPPMNPPGISASAPIYVGQTAYTLVCSYFTPGTAGVPVFRSSNPSVLRIGVASQAHWQNDGVSAYFIAMEGVDIGISTVAVYASTTATVPDTSFPVNVDAAPPAGGFTPRFVRHEIQGPPVLPFVTLRAEVDIAAAARGGTVSVRSFDPAVTVDAVRVENLRRNTLFDGTNDIEVDLRLDPTRLLEDRSVQIQMTVENRRGQGRAVFGMELRILPLPTLDISGFTETEIPLEFESTWEGVESRIALELSRSDVSRTLDLELETEGVAWINRTLNYDASGCNRPGPGRIRLERGARCRLDLRFRPDAPGRLAPGNNLLRLIGAAQGPIELWPTGEAEGRRRIAVVPYGAPGDQPDILDFGDFNPKRADEPDILYFGDIPPGATVRRRLDIVNTSHPDTGPVRVRVALEDANTPFSIVGGPRVIEIAPEGLATVRLEYSATGPGAGNILHLRDADAGDTPASLLFDREVLIGAKTKEMRLRLRASVPAGVNRVPLDTTCLQSFRPGPDHDAEFGVLRVDLTAKTSVPQTHDRDVAADGWVVGPCAGAQAIYENIPIDPSCVTTNTRSLPRGEARYQISVNCLSPRRGIPALDFNVVTIFSNEARDVRGGGNHLPYPSFELWLDEMGPWETEPVLLYSFQAAPGGVSLADEREIFTFPPGGALGNIRDQDIDFPGLFRELRR